MTTHTRGAPTVFFISLLWPLAALATPAPGVVDPSGGIAFLGGNYDGHPMLYFGRGEEEELQRSAAGSRGALAGRIRQAGEAMLAQPDDYLPPWSPAEFSARWNEVYGNNLGALSIFCLLYPHRAGALDMARDYMERMAAQPSWYIFLSLFLFFFTFSLFPLGTNELLLPADARCVITERSVITKLLTKYILSHLKLDLPSLL